MAFITFWLGTHPTLHVGHNGEVLIAARVGSGLQGGIGYPGSQVFEGPFQLEDAAAAPLGVADDPFALAQAHEGAARWLLARRLDVEGDPVDVESADEGASWKESG